MITSQQFARAAKRSLKWLWFKRSSVPILDIPIPSPLPYGGIFLAYGDVMGLSVVGSTLLGKYENKEEWKFVQKYLRPGMCCMDVGANQGFFTILASQRLKKEDRVFAFEPSPREFARLKRNIWLNRCANVILENIAVGSREGVTDFYMCLGNQGSLSSIRPQAADVTARRKLIQVPATTLDIYARKKDIESIGFIKVDVEGGELDVLKGATGVLAEYRPVLMCEVADVRTMQWGYKARDIYDFLNDYRYSWYSVADNGNLTPLLPKGRYDNNLVAVPREKVFGLVEKGLILT
jgi:FkbM family methyltransferase